MTQSHPRKIAVIGAGEIGLGIGAVFAESGSRVWLVEPDPIVRTCIAERLGELRSEMALAGMARNMPLGSLLTIAGISKLPKDVELVIEAGPEDVQIKRDLFASLRTHIGSAVPIATTSSAIAVSTIVEPERQRRACLVAHPANPPTLIRTIECVPAPQTDPAVIDLVDSFLRSAGFEPVPVLREVEGFAMNRLQSALLREAYRLVEDGIVDVEGVDRIVAEALGPRWALSGPFETADLNTPGGIEAHARRLGPAYARIGLENGERGVPWSEALVGTVARQRRTAVPDSILPARVKWRRRALARLLAARREAMELWNPDQSKKNV